MNYRVALASLLVAATAACAAAKPSPSHVTSPYLMKVDDSVWEASIVPLRTTRDAVIAPDCGPVAAAQSPGGLDALVAKGLAARLPANVTIYTTPDDSIAPGSTPSVVTDDRYAGKLCTPDAIAIEK